MNFKVIQESYTESHTTNLDKTLHKRVLFNDTFNMKVTIEQPSAFDEMFNRQEEVRIDFKVIQTKLK